MMSFRDKFLEKSRKCVCFWWAAFATVPSMSRINPKRLSKQILHAISHFMLQNAPKNPSTKDYLKRAGETNTYNEDFMFIF